MLGDAQDMRSRLGAVLPNSWFADDIPILTAVLDGLSSTWAGLYELLCLVRSQTRIATSTGEWLDRVVLDFFGQRMRRTFDESDTALRLRLGAEMHRERATRQAMITKITELTGIAPTIIEPCRAADTGVWGQQLAWGFAGAWGSLMMPQQFFMTVTRPSEHSAMTYPGDAVIQAAVVDLLPINGLAWLQISN